MSSAHTRATPIAAFTAINVCCGRLRASVSRMKSEVAAATLLRPVSRIASMRANLAIPPGRAVVAGASASCIWRWNPAIDVSTAPAMTAAVAIHARVASG